MTVLKRILVKGKRSHNRTSTDLRAHMSQDVDRTAGNKRLALPGSQARRQDIEVCEHVSMMSSCVNKCRSCSCLPQAALLECSFQTELQINEECSSPCMPSRWMGPGKKYRVEF